MRIGNSFMNYPLISTDILSQLKGWIQDAEQSEPNDPTAVCLSTLGHDGFPDSRMVLARIIDERGFAFFTNHQSKKGEDLLAYPKASMCFHWKTLRRQIRLQGLIEICSEQESDDYYNGRARDSRIGAWASEQSRPMGDRSELLGRVALFEDKFNGIDNPPRPPHWAGFRLIPHKIEFWQDGEFRLHDRMVHTWNGTSWDVIKLYP